MKHYPFKEQTLGHILMDKAATRGDKVFLEFENGATVTYGACNEATNSIANGLRRLGLNKGDTLATFLPNSIDSIYLWFGAAKAGIIEVPINLANKGNFLSHMINNSDCKAIIIDRDLLDRLQFIADDVPGLRTVVVWSKTGNMEALPKIRFNVLSYRDLLDNPPKNLEVEVKSSDPQMIMYTLGTTGAAKGVLDCHSMIYLSAFEYIEATRATQKDVFFMFLPLFHANARILCIYPTLLLGTKAVIYEKFSASRFWDQVRKHKATMFNSLRGHCAVHIQSTGKTGGWGQPRARVRRVPYAA